MQEFIEIEIEDEGKAVRRCKVPVGEGDTPIAVAERASVFLEIAAADLVGDCEEAVGALRSNRSGSQTWRIRRVCVELHFESEVDRHSFSARARWEVVHEWGCRNFRVARDLCANLELREGSIDGPAIGEKKELGTFEGCRVVWLVKPGPEING